MKAAQGSRVETGERLARRLCSRDIEGSPDLGQNPIEALFHLVVGETKLEEAVGLDDSPPLRIGERLICMMRPIEFDREPRVVTAKIHDETEERHLPPELPVVETAAAQLLPQDILGARVLSAQAAGDASAADRHPNRDSGGEEPRPTLSQGERVTAMGEGRALSGYGAPLIRPLRGHLLPLGEGRALP
jgi:hypothetical protein